MTGTGSLEAGGAILQLRPVRPEDADFLVEVYASTREEELNLTNWDAAARDAFVRMQFKAQHTHYHTYYPDAQYDIIELNQQRIGRLYVRQNEAETVLMDITLLPQFRQQGIGSRILQALLQDASTAKRAVTLHVETNNPRAHSWYLRFGFVDVSTEGIHILMRCEPT